jgi:hypothetical protein
VRGFEQELGIDFEEVFSPVMRHNSLRTLAGVSGVNDLEVKPHYSSNSLAGLKPLSSSPRTTGATLPATS